MTETVYPHHVRALAKELESARYNGLNADEAFAVCCAGAKRISRIPCPATEEEAAAFPAGVPGMRVSRELFDEAWIVMKGQ